MKKSFLFLCVLILLAGGLALTSYLKFSKRSERKEESVPTQILEKFLKEAEASEETTLAYRFALDNPEAILNNVICYCGCFESKTHANARECFINPENERKGREDIFDSMGKNCGLCVKTVLTAKELYGQGRTGDEVRKIIDSRYKRG